MFSAVRILAIVGFCLGLPGCAEIPVEETKQFSSAVLEFEGASGPFLDQLSVAERSIGRKAAIRRASVVRAGDSLVVRTFHLRDAPYFASLGDPPSVAVFRRAFKVIHSYSETLVALSENKNVPEIQGSLTSLLSSLKSLGAVTKISVLAGPLGAALPAALAELNGIVEQAIAAQNAAEARRLVIDGAPLVSALIASLREAAPSTLAILTNDSAVAMARAAARGDSAVQANADRGAFQVTQVANYIMLLEQLERSFDMMVAAYRRPSDPMTLARLAKHVATLAADAASFRKAYHLLTQAR